MYSGSCRTLFFSHRLEVLDGHLPLVYDTEVLDLSKLTESAEDTYCIVGFEAVIDPQIVRQVCNR